MSSGQYNEKEKLTMNVSKKKHTKMWWVLGLGLVFIPSWLLFFYLASLALYDLLVDTLVVALALGILSYLLSKVLNVETKQEALVSGCVWAFLLFLVELLITLLNETTGIIFGTWATYVVYVVIALAPWLALLTARPRVQRQEAVR
jgi:hypothetical protein